MSGPIFFLVMMLVTPALLVLWNKRRIKGKMLCIILRKDKSVRQALCELRDDFVIYKSRAYDVYPDFVRVTGFPSGWPQLLQELVPTSLYLEEDAIPLDWVYLDNRIERAMELKSALDENFFRKMIHETSQEAGGGLNLRKMLPILLMVVGVLGLGALLFMGGCPKPTP